MFEYEYLGYQLQSAQSEPLDGGEPGFVWVVKAKSGGAAAAPLLLKVFQTGGYASDDSEYEQIKDQRRASLTLHRQLAATSKLWAGVVDIGVVRPMDRFALPDGVYVVTEYLPHSVADLLDAGPASQREIIPIVGGVASALLKLASTAPRGHGRLSITNIRVRENASKVVEGIALTDLEAGAKEYSRVEDLQKLGELIVRLVLGRKRGSPDAPRQNSDAWKALKDGEWWRQTALKLYDASDERSFEVLKEITSKLRITTDTSDSKPVIVAPEADSKFPKTPSGEHQQADKPQPKSGSGTTPSPSPPTSFTAMLPPQMGVVRLSDVDRLPIRPPETQSVNDLLRSIEIAERRLRDALRKIQETLGDDDALLGRSIDATGALFAGSSGKLRSPVDVAKAVLQAHDTIAEVISRVPDALREPSDTRPVKERFDLDSFRKGEWYATRIRPTFSVGVEDLRGWTTELARFRKAPVSKERLPERLGLARLGESDRLAFLPAEKASLETTWKRIEQAAQRITTRSAEIQKLTRLSSPDALLSKVDRAIDAVIVLDRPFRMVPEVLLTTLSAHERAAESMDKIHRWLNERASDGRTNAEAHDFGAFTKSPWLKRFEPAEAKVNVAVLGEWITNASQHKRAASAVAPAAPVESPPLPPKREEAVAPPKPETKPETKTESKPDGKREPAPPIEAETKPVEPAIPAPAEKPTKVEKKDKPTKSAKQTAAPTPPAPEVEPVVEIAPAIETPAPAIPIAPRKKSNTGLFVGIGVAAVVVLGVGAFLLSPGKAPKPVDPPPGPVAIRSFQEEFAGPIAQASKLSAEVSGDAERAIATAKQKYAADPKQAAAIQQELIAEISRIASSGKKPDPKPTPGGKEFDDVYRDVLARRDTFKGTADESRANALIDNARKSFDPSKPSHDEDIAALNAQLAALSKANVPKPPETPKGEPTNIDAALATLKSGILDRDLKDAAAEADAALRASVANGLSIADAGKRAALIKQSIEPIGNAAPWPDPTKDLAATPKAEWAKSLRDVFDKAPDQRKVLVAAAVKSLADGKPLPDLAGEYAKITKQLEAARAAAKSGAIAHAAISTGTSASERAATSGEQTLGDAVASAIKDAQAAGLDAKAIGLEAFVPVLAGKPSEVVPLAVPKPQAESVWRSVLAMSLPKTPGTQPSWQSVATALKNLPAESMKPERKAAVFESVASVLERSSPQDAAAHAAVLTQLRDWETPDESPAKWPLVRANIMLLAISGNNGRFVQAQPDAKAPPQDRLLGLLRAVPATNVAAKAFADRLAAAAKPDVAVKGKPSDAWDEVPADGPGLLLRHKTLRVGEPEVPFEMRFLPVQHSESAGSASVPAVTYIAVDELPVSVLIKMLSESAELRALATKAPSANVANSWILSGDNASLWAAPADQPDRPWLGGAGSDPTPYADGPKPPLPTFNTPAQRLSMGLIEKLVADLKMQRPSPSAWIAALAQESDGTPNLLGTEWRPFIGPRRLNEGLHKGGIVATLVPKDDGVIWFRDVNPKATSFQNLGGNVAEATSDGNAIGCSAFSKANTDCKNILNVPKSDLFFADLGIRLAFEGQAEPTSSPEEKIAKVLKDAPLLPAQ